MGRRDMQFYDLYKNRQDFEDVQLAQDKHVEIDGVLKGEWIDPVTKEVKPALEGENEPIYGDIEIDYDKLHGDEDLIDTRFGQSISVKLEVI
jgi:hypothetical protein